MSCRDLEAGLGVSRDPAQLLELLDRRLLKLPGDRVEGHLARQRLWIWSGCAQCSISIAQPQLMRLMRRPSCDGITLSLLL